MHKSIDFEPRQIVFLACGMTRLYGEVIQVVVARQVCWVRPLMLVEIEESTLIADLRCCADLVLPIDLFQVAVDTDVILPLSQLLASEMPAEGDRMAQQQMHEFIQQVWKQFTSAD